MAEGTQDTTGRGWLPRAFFHPLSLVGLALIMLGIFGGAAFLIAGSLMEDTPSYLGLALVPFLLMIVAGVVIVPLGIRLYRRRISRGEAGQARLVIDFARPTHRHAAAFITIVGLVAGIVGVIASVETVVLMESPDFCGNTCHSVMNPEFVAHQNAPHSQLKCVECHVGPGVEGAVEAKLSGIRRMVSTALGTIHRPIPTPIADMSSATVTCEKCHARARLGGFRERRFNYYASDEANTPNEMRMLINTGAADSMLVSGFGIHYHMLAASKVEYVALDQKRQEIAWLRVTRADGTTEEFEHQDYAVGEEERRELPVREMSCLDCHNRPAHPFRAPQDLVNAALANGKLDRTLPSLKVEAVRALDGGYGSTEEAMEGIAEAVRGFYEGEYPEIAQEKAAQIDQAVETLQSMYRHSFFPDMQAQWSAYPNNIGHRDWPGCFRCHSDFMVSTSTDEPLFTECTACHVILAQGESLQGDDVEISLARVFYHPGYDEEIEEYSQCIDCHTGGADLY